MVGTQRLPAAYRLERDPAASEAKLHIAIDVALADAERGVKDFQSLLKQICNSYGAARRSKKPAKLSVVGVGPVFRERIAATSPGHEQWAVHFDDRPFDQALPKDSIVYLSADAEDVVEKLEEGKVYVIGGIVDHGKEKGLALREAQRAGVKTARLPIDEHMKSSTRRVLTVNHVFELLQMVHDLDGDWAESMERVLPSRKGFIRKSTEKGGDSGDTDQRGSRRPRDAVVERQDASAADASEAACEDRRENKRARTESLSDRAEHPK